MRSIASSALAPAVAAIFIAACGGAGDTTVATGETTAAGDHGPRRGDHPRCGDHRLRRPLSPRRPPPRGPRPAAAVTIEGAGAISSVFLPKCTNIPVFPQANEGAMEAAEGASVRTRRSSSARPTAVRPPGRSSSRPTAGPRASMRSWCRTTPGTNWHHRRSVCGRRRYPGGQLGLTDSSAEGESGLHRSGGLRRDRPGHGRHGARDTR